MLGIVAMIGRSTLSDQAIVGGIQELVCHIASGGFDQVDALIQPIRHLDDAANFQLAIVTFDGTIDDGCGIQLNQSQRVHDPCWIDG